MESEDFVLGNIFDDNLFELMAKGNQKADHNKIGCVKYGNLNPVRTVTLIYFATTALATSIICTKTKSCSISYVKNKRSNFKN